MPGYSGSITYKLTGNLTLNSFPFLKRETGENQLLYDLLIPLKEKMEAVSCTKLEYNYISDYVC